MNSKRGDPSVRAGFEMDGVWVTTEWFPDHLAAQEWLDDQGIEAYELMDS